MKRLLLGSGGMSTPERKQAWRDECDNFLGDVKKVLFVPYAGFDWDGYVAKVDELNLHPYRETEGIHTFENQIQAIEEAEAIHVGGGNTFRLLKAMQDLNLLEPIRTKVLSGDLPYMGISAGSNMAAPSIATTNDMPIVCPNGFGALGLVPFQINAHYTPSKTYYYNEHEELLPYGGESRDDRLREYHEENTTPILALSEGSILRCERGDMRLVQLGYGKWMQQGQETKELKVGDAIPKF